MKKWIFILVILFLFGCAENSSDESKNDDTGTSTELIDSDSTVVTTGNSSESYTLTGKIQDGPCLSGADVFIYSLTSDTLDQISGANFQGKTDSVGAYSIPAQITIETNPYAEIFVNAACKNEVTGETMPFKTYRAIIDLSAGEDNNANPPTTATVDRLRQLFKDDGLATFQDFTESRSQAETEYMSAHGITGITTPFTNMSIEDDDDAGAALLAMNVIHLQGNPTVEEQSAFLADMSYQLVHNDGILDDETQEKIKNNSKNLNLVKIKKNHKNQYALIGLMIDTPKFHRVVDSNGNGSLNKDDPSYTHIELLERTPKVKYKINDHLGGGASFDTDDNRFFSFPFIFDSDVESKYIITNVSGEYMSWRSNDDKGDGDHNNDQPSNTVLVSAPKIPDDFFDSTLKDDAGNEYSIPDTFSAKIEFTFITGVKYWLVMYGDSPYAATMGSPSGLIDFARNLHSVDGVNWIGSDQNATSFRADKAKIIFTD